MATFSDGSLPDQRSTTRRVIAHQVREDTRIPVTTTLRYDSRDPYAVGFVFHVAPGADVVWYVDRGMLHAGVDAPAGTGDVRVSPSPGGEVLLDLDRDGHRALIAVDRGPLVKLLRKSYALVPLGGESAHLDWTAVTDALAS
ncbi:SsgA family sporulation/cell division regulator [Streptomyces genisteinicus]|uniref:SsgA family sporulation/cell division regulator n=1 Tax=Streptomyces genisteinicus TaxID=2768068 RepID=A0A7H0I224_9ACTN|nr:SsgA family sporulation/cell division regulator [Streptomyces genisteinicus]QNP66840.1 SsgA family sporulation/cell division regulator [Streptomyces genisteinicus]